MVGEWVGGGGGWAYFAGEIVLSFERYFLPPARCQTDPSITVAAFSSFPIPVVTIRG